MFLIFSSESLDKKNVFPFDGYAFKSESKTLVNCKLKSLNPENPESTTNKANEPTTTAEIAMRVMILTAFLLLLEYKYRFAT